MGWGTYKKQEVLEEENQKVKDSENKALRKGEKKPVDLAWRE